MSVIELSWTAKKATLIYDSNAVLSEVAEIKTWLTDSLSDKVTYWAVLDATFYSEDKIDKKYLSTGR